tara:strand:- start:7313 stop:8335 length:1023 start_codon:yes stop_codon:yes gene_type:complete
MKVAQVMGGNEEGGLEKHFVELCNGLVAQGVEVVAIAHPKYANRFLPEVTFEPVDMAQGRRNPFALYELYKALSRQHVDVLHAQAGKAVAMVNTLLPWLKLPAVATQHNIKSSQSYQRFADVIAVSEAVASAIPHEQPIIIHNGISPPERASRDVLEALRVALALPNGPVFLSVARLVPAKGLDLLLEAWGQINCAGILLLVGDGPERASLEAQAAKLNLSHRVRFLGQRDDISVFISLADALLISSHREGGPYTLTEALLLECPVLSTCVGMVPDYLPVQFICTPSQPEALTELLRAHLANPANLREKQRAVFADAREKLTLAAMVKANIVVYERVLSS